MPRPAAWADTAANTDMENMRMNTAQRPASQSRRRMQTAMAIVMTAGLTISVGAWADWAVNDRDAIEQLKAIHKSIGDKGNGPTSKTLLEYQKYQSTVTKGDFSPDASNGDQQGRYKDPDVMFKSDDVTLTKNASAKLTSITMDDSTRCPQPTKPSTDSPSGGPASPSVGGDGIPEQQHKVCMDILETQKGQFKYNVMMSELADVRYKRLQQIERDRGNIDELDAGKLQDNTNRMLALIALIQIDQQQQKAYNDAYNTRIVYLQGVQERLSQRALHGNGKTSPLDIVGSLGEYATLGAALGVSPDDLISK